MKIIVCIKQVPDTEAKINLAPDGIGIDDTEVNYIINPYDELAIEEGLRIKESLGEGEVVLISLGPERASTALRSGLAMGADRAIHINDLLLDENDPLLVATLLSKAIQQEGYDLILCGQQGVGTDHGQVGSILAELLGIPQVNIIIKLQITQGKAVAHREIEGVSEVVETTPPALFTAQKGLNEPRYPSLKGIMTAKKKPLTVLNCQQLGFNEEEVSRLKGKTPIIKLELPPMRPKGKVVEGEPSEMVRQLIEWLQRETGLL